MKNKYGQARLDIQLANDIITVYHSDGTILLSWEATENDWPTIWNTLQKCNDIAELKEKAVKDIHNQIDNMNTDEILNLAKLLNLKF
jgi:hypothetical protein